MDPILIEFPTRFETERLVISIYENGDGEEFYNPLLSSHEHLQEELSEVHTIKSVQDAEAYVRHKRLAWISRKRLPGRWLGSCG
jgi:hypothetical protein